MIRIGGFVPFTTIDYPGCLAAVIFCQGCPWRCRYCHNPHLLPARGANEIAWSQIARRLQERRGLLDAVVFSGGEPTLQAALPDAMRAVKAMGFRVGLHTAGIYPKRLAEVLPLVDWVGMDIKAPFEDYDALTHTPGSARRARESLELVLASGVAHELRTTADSRLTDEKLEQLARELVRLGATRHVLQRCRPPPALPAV
jgi:pyruvate formate lyase activating enzyme